MQNNNYDFVQYLAYCTKCGKQCVGSIQNQKARLSNCKSDIKKVNHF